MRLRFSKARIVALGGLTDLALFGFRCGSYIGADFRADNAVLDSVVIQQFAPD